MKMIPDSYPLDGGTRHRLHVDQLLLFFLRQRVERFRHAQLAAFGAALEQPGQHVLDVDVDLLDRRPGNDLEGRKRLLAHLDLDLFLIEPALAQLLAQLLPSALGLLANRRRLFAEVGGRQRRQQQIEDALFRGLTRLLAHFGGALFANHVHRQLGQVANHRLDVATDVTDLGKLRRLDLDEGGLREPRQAPGDLGLADASRSNHQDVLRRDFFGEFRRKPLPPHAIPERDRHGPLRVRLPDDVLVEFDDDLPRRERLNHRGGRLGKVNGHPLQRFDGDGGIRIDADVGGYRHRLFGDASGVELCVPG
jgi:hypothetical protein